MIRDVEHRFTHLLALPSHLVFQTLHRKCATQEPQCQDPNIHVNPALSGVILYEHPHFSTFTFGFTSMSCQLKVDSIFVGPIAPRSNKLHLTKLCNTRLLFWQAFLFQKTCISHIIAKRDRDLQHSTKCDDSTWKFSSI